MGETKKEFMKYSIITCARNEEKYILKTLESVVNQTVLPTEWVILNDGSTDKTKSLIESYASKYPWIIQVDLINFKPELISTGGRVSHLLNIAKNKLKQDFDIVTKLDADTEFDSTFFENIILEFLKDPSLGIASGQLVFEGIKEFHEIENTEVRGAVMMIRKEVYTQIGGFFESKGRGSDTLFGVAARYYGWKAKTVFICFNHLKPEGIKQSYFLAAKTTGFYKGSIPYRFDFFLITLIKHAFKKPYIIGSLIQLGAYISSRYIIKYRPFPDLVRKQIHKEQIQRIKSIFRIK